MGWTLGPSRYFEPWYVDNKIVKTQNLLTRNYVKFDYP